MHLKYTVKPNLDKSFRFFALEKAQQYQKVLFYTFMIWNILIFDVS